VNEADIIVGKVVIPMAERVYLETTIVSYLTSRPSRDVVIAGHQQTTQEWWDTRREKYELCVSQLVLGEAGAGDLQAAQIRLAAMNAMTLLETTTEALALAKELIQAGALPAKAADDALHIAVAATSYKWRILPIDMELPSPGECRSAAPD
jgi:hypothetical protein